MQKLSKCVFDAITCVELEDKLIRVLEGNALENKVLELHDKLTRVEKDQSSLKPLTQQMKPIETLKSDRLNGSYKHVQTSVQQQRVLVDTGNSVDAYIDRIYVLTDDSSQKNSSLERNKKILIKVRIDYEIIHCKDMTLHNYQNQIREIVKDSKQRGYRRIMIINGNDSLNNKFNDLLDKQISKITGECYLWFLGNTRDTPAKDVLNTRFDVDDYLFLYDDIVNAKLTTEEKARTHWKTYGHREARYGAIDVVNGSSQLIVNTYGFVVSSEIYDVVIDLINRQTIRDCKNILLELQTNTLDAKTVWCSRPDLIIPCFSNSVNHSKNCQLALRNGWYYNFYK